MHLPCNHAAGIGTSGLGIGSSNSIVTTDSINRFLGSIQRGSIRLTLVFVCVPDCLCSWIHSQSSDQLWSDGVRDYLRHVDGLLADFRDVVPTTGKLNGNRMVPLSTGILVMGSDSCLQR